MSTLKVNKVESTGTGSDAEHLALATNGSTQMYLTSAGALSGTGGSITNFTGLGKVLQVIAKDTVSTTAISTDSLTPITEVDIHITPTAASSTFIVYGTGSLGGSSSTRLYAGFSRDVIGGVSGTLVGCGDARGSRLQAAQGIWCAGAGAAEPFAVHGNDSPNTTSELRYRLTAGTNSGTAYVNRSKLITI